MRHGIDSPNSVHPQTPDRSLPSDPKKHIQLVVSFGNPGFIPSLTPYLLHQLGFFSTDASLPWGAKAWVHSEHPALSIQRFRPKKPAPMWGWVKMKPGIGPPGFHLRFANIPMSIHPNVGRSSIWVCRLSIFATYF